MTFRMENLERLSMAEMEEFVTSNRSVKFDARGTKTSYGLIEKVLRFHRYLRLPKRDRGTIRSFLEKATGLSRAQLTRLIGRWSQLREVKRKRAQRPSFRTRYKKEDITLLAEVDAAHDTLSGPAVRHLLQRGLEVYGDGAYERLAGISVAHIYNLRLSPGYRKLRVNLEKTKGRKVSIAERRKPEPKGRPGYLRVDTVHQGNQDGQFGVYHINAVDTVTQWEVVGCVQTICERDVEPMLEAMLHQFPFVIRGFHCDNGSEYINYTVKKTLKKHQVEFTKSRAYRTTDNALVEGKNGAVVRKHIGYGPIGAEQAEAVQKFYTAHLNPYLNFHRPCGFATIEIGAKGKRKRIYRLEDYRTPYEKLTTLSNWKQYLKPGVSAEFLQTQAQKCSDTEAAKAMQNAKLAMLAQTRQKR